MTQTDQVHVTDGMIIEWDVPIDMDDGPAAAGRYLPADRARTLTGAAIPWTLRERRKL